MKRAIVLTSCKHGHQVNWGQAFAAGLERHGWKATLSEDPGKCDMLCLWGVRRRHQIARQKQVGGEVCIIERGYVGDRFKWCSVSFGGGLNGRGKFRGPFHDPSRWNTHFADLMRPWRDDRAGDVLLMGQVSGDMSLTGVDIGNWYREATHAFQAQGFRVRFRPHPHGKTDAMPLEDDLRDARFVVTWNSNSAVDAVIAGVPAVAMDKGSMAWGVTGHELRPPPRPDRDAWAHALAWKQWTKDEMASGYCWEVIGQ